MSKNGPVILLGLDAFDPELARGWAQAGELPTLARLFESSASCAVENPFGLFVGSLWVNFTTGVRPDRHGFHCWDGIEVDTYKHRLKSAAVAQRPFWEILGDHGLRAAMVDVPHAKAGRSANGIAVAEWGCHDRHFGFHTSPPELAENIVREIGHHPIFGVDPYAKRDFAPDDYVHRAGPLRTLDEEKALLSGLIAGVKAKGRLLNHLAAQEDWDLFLAVFGESHAVGHHQWHLHDPDHPRFTREGREAVGGDPLLQVYRATDAAMGELLAAAGPDTTIMVLMSHGMGPHYDGTHLLEQMLTRLDRFHRAGRGRSRLSSAARRAVRAVAPFGARLARHLRIPRRLQLAAEDLIGTKEHATLAARRRQRYFLEPNNYVYGGIRLNLAGREPDGCVAREEVTATCDQLEKDLLEIVNVATGRPAIRSVERCDRHHRRPPGDSMPDLFLDWDRSAPIETVRSPKIGTLHAPYLGWRSGDHRPAGLLLASGPGLPGRSFAPIAVEDIAVAVSDRLGVALQEVDGKPVQWLSEPIGDAGEETAHARIGIHS